MKKWTKNLEFTFLLIGCYLSIIALMGYKFGFDDMTEVLSYARSFNNPELYPNDLYIQSISSNPINERTAFSWLLSFGHEHIELFAMILHALFSMLLIAGMYKVAALFIYNRFFRWLSILATIVLLNNINIGGNEIYYNYLVPAIAAKSIGIWVFYRILKGQWLVACMLIIPSVMFQAIVGAQLLLIFLIVFLVSNEWRGNNKIVLQLALICLPTIVWLLYLFLYHNEADSSSLTQVSYWEIINFRMPHHYLIDHVPINDLVISLLLYSLGLLISFQKFPKLKVPMLAIVAGMILYFVGCIVRIDIFLQTQWLKTTIWLELFSVIMILAWVNQKMVLKIKMLYFFPILLLICYLLIHFNFPPLSKKPYYIGKSWAHNDAVDIARMASLHTNRNDVFAIPPDNSTFRYASGRNVYVDFKSIAHNKTYLNEWYSRITQVYGLSTSDEGGFSAVTKGLQYYQSLNTEQVRKMQEIGIDYWLTYKSQKLDLPIITQNDTYIVYSLTD